MNVQNQILKGITELLHQHNFLVIPGFGGFVLKSERSHFSSNGGMIYPPSKTIGFNAQLKQDDGLLLLWLKENIQCSPIEASAHLKNFSEYCNSLLTNKGRLNIEGIGFFYTNFDGKLCFEPQQHVNFLKSGFGLSPISLKELAVEEITKEIHTEDRVLAVSENESALKTKNRNLRKIAYASVVGALLFSGLLIFVSNTKMSGKLKAAFGGTEVKSSYAPIQYDELKLNSVVNEIKNYTADVNGIAVLELEEHKTVAVKTFEVVEIVNPKNTHESILNRKGDFEVVLGCFSIKRNAMKLITQLKSKNISGFVSGKNEKGLFVVSGGGFKTKEHALEQLEILRSTCPKAWIRKAN